MARNIKRVRVNLHQWFVISFYLLMITLFAVVTFV